MRELYSVQAHPEVQLAATAALISAHQSARIVDHDAITQLAAYMEVRCSACTTCPLPGGVAYHEHESRTQHP